jgi:hypothetical protein
MELVHQYLTGPKFRHRLKAIVEKFSDMQADLDPTATHRAAGPRVASTIEEPPVDGAGDCSTFPGDERVLL